MKHLTLSDRIRIETMIEQGKSFSQIAKALGKYPTTISREIRNHRSVVPHYTSQMSRKRRECEHLGSCTHDFYFYRAKYADDAYHELKTSSRTGINQSPES